VAVPKIWDSHFFINDNFCSYEVEAVPKARISFPSQKEEIMIQ
jgi:hypothetical protein